MYGCVVAGTDGSSTAREAVWHAAAQAKAFSAKLHIVCAYGDGSPDWAEAVLRKAADELHEQEDVEAEVHAVPGDAADAILEVADQESAELIVVGNRGMAPDRFKAGSVPNEVSHRALCSVLIVATT